MVLVSRPDRDDPVPDAPTDATLGELGEAAVLRRIFPRLPDAAVALVGPGDDAAVLAAPDGRYVVTTDTMVHGPDFRLAWSTPHDLGWKAAATNLADIAAMGARATALVVAVAAPPETPVVAARGARRRSARCVRRAGARMRCGRGRPAASRRRSSSR